MERFPLGIIRVMSLPEAANLSFAARLHTLFPNLEMVVRCIPDQPDGVYDDSSFRRAAPKVVAAARQLQQEGVAGVLVNCAEDPGLAEIRATIDLPAFGAGSAAALAARASGLPVGVIGLTDSPPPVIREVLGAQLIVSAAPEGVQTALDLDGAAESIVQTGLRFREQGVRCIVLACTGMTILGTARHLRETLGLPVVDPLMAALTLADHCLSGKPDYRSGR